MNKLRKIIVGILYALIAISVASLFAALILNLTNEELAFIHIEIGMIIFFPSAIASVCLDYFWPE